MKKLSKTEIEEIQRSAKEDFDGKIDLAIAAHVHGAAVVARCGGVVPVFANKYHLGQLKRQITIADKAKK